jgi:hypothetical protein
MWLLDPGSILGAYSFWEFFRSEGGREIRFSKEKKYNFRGYSKKNLPSYHTNGDRPE